MKADWVNLGVVETIYEENEEEESSSSSTTFSSPSPPSSSPTDLHSRVHSWSLANGCNTDVVIRVQGTRFQLHREPLASRSAYLKRQLTCHSQLTLAPPLNITAETFCTVADFCYGSRVAITPFNVAALGTAAELLQMTETNPHGEENLKQITEAFFDKIVNVNREYALIVFRSCLALLPEAETTAYLVSKCIEVLCLTDDGYSVVDLIDELVALEVEDFVLVTESMNQRVASHNVLYEIVDLYLQQKNGEVSEEQKAQICSSIDCNKLSTEFLMHVVQNPRMPLRFIIRAMLAEQLLARVSIVSGNGSDQQNSLAHHHVREESMTLGAILQRDEALREAAQLKAAMNSTSLRIQSLEAELNAMKKLLSEAENKENNSKILMHVHDPNHERSILTSGKAASFHYGKATNKVVAGDRGSVSSVNYRNARIGGDGGVFELPSSSSEGSRNESPNMKKKIGKRLINGFKNAFRVSKQGSRKKNKQSSSGVTYSGNSGG